MLYTEEPQSVRTSFVSHVLVSLALRLHTHLGLDKLQFHAVRETRGERRLQLREIPQYGFLH